ncbi:hypothetical protein GLP43_14355 [Sulfitobacter sp. M39]|nr:hypothetical protein [Sulfitobacter sp. M39]
MAHSRRALWGASGLRCTTCATINK